MRRREWIPAKRMSRSFTSDVDSMIQDMKERMEERYHQLFGKRSGSIHKRETKSNRKERFRKLAINRKKKALMSHFRDEATITVRGGMGGAGCNSTKVSIRSGRGMRKYPDGGHGGEGGSIFLETNSSFSSLRLPNYILTGGRGRNGSSNKKKGKRGKDVVISVPVGTEIHRIEERPGAYRYVYHNDLDTEGERILLARGGRPGLGSQIFQRKSMHQIRQSMHKMNGSPGEEGRYLLVLKSIADIGLVGFPNAGKSTLLHQLSRATPKIASYPFTTLRPFLGCLECPGDDGLQATIADIPGIIEGAHSGKGLGLKFLRHIERTSCLFYVVDTTGDTMRVEGSLSKPLPPHDAFLKLRHEIESYQDQMLERPSVVLANKIDDPRSQQNLDALQRVVPSHIPILPISALTGEGIHELKLMIYSMVKSMRQTKEEEGDSQTERPDPEERIGPWIMCDESKRTKNTKKDSDDVDLISDLPPLRRMKMPDGSWIMTDSSENYEETLMRMNCESTMEDEPEGESTEMGNNDQETSSERLTDSSSETDEEEYQDELYYDSDEEDIYE